MPVFLPLWKMPVSQPCGFSFLYSPARTRAKAGNRGPTMALTCPRQGQVPWCSQGTWPWSLIIWVTFIVSTYPVSFSPGSGCRWDPPVWTHLQPLKNSYETLDIVFSGKGAWSPRKAAPDISFRPLPWGCPYSAQHVGSLLRQTRVYRPCSHSISLPWSGARQRQACHSSKLRESARVRRSAKTVGSPHCRDLPLLQGDSWRTKLLSKVRSIFSTHSEESYCQKGTVPAGFRSKGWYKVRYKGFQ